MRHVCLQQLGGSELAAKNRITTNLDEKKYEELTALSKKLDVSLAWLGRRAFADLLEKYNKGEIANEPTNNKLIGRS